MNRKALFAAGLIGAVAAFASAQDDSTNAPAPDTSAPAVEQPVEAPPPDMSAPTDTQSTTSQKTTTTTTTTGPITGSVVEYQPGHTIVLRDASQKTVTYTLSPNVQIPSGVAVGRKVTIYTQPGSGNVVSRVTTVGMTSDGRMKTTTSETSTAPSGAMTRTKTVHVMGTVQTYEAGKSVTLTRPDGSTVTYMINDQSQLPADVAVGKKVTVTTTTMSGQPVIQRMTYTTRTTTTTSVQPH